MGRPERPLDPAAGPIQAFASELRRLRQQAGSPKYLQMQRRTGRSRTALAEAAGGDHLPTWDTVEAYVRACGGDLTQWQARWAQARDAVRSQRGQAAPQGIAAEDLPRSPRASRFQRWLTAARPTSLRPTVADKAFQHAEPRAAPEITPRGLHLRAVTSHILLSTRRHQPVRDRADSDEPGTRGSARQLAQQQAR